MMTCRGTTSTTMTNIPAGGSIMPKKATNPAEMLRELGVKPAKTLPAGLLAQPFDEDAEGAG